MGKRLGMQPTECTTLPSTGSDAGSQPSLLPAMVDTSDTTPAASRSHEPWVPRVDQNAIPVCTEDQKDSWDPAITDVSSCAPDRIPTRRAIQLCTGGASSLIDATHAVAVTPGVFTARICTWNCPVDSRPPHQVHKQPSSPILIARAKVASSIQKHIRHSAILSAAAEQSEFEDETFWAPPDFPPPPSSANHNINHAEVAVATRLPVPRPGFYAVYAPSEDRFRAPRVFPPAASGGNQVLNNAQVTVASQIPVPGGALKQLGRWSTGKRVVMCFPSPAKLFNRDDPPNETMFEQGQKHKRIQQAEDGAWKTLKGKRLSDEVASGKHVVRKGEVIESCNRPANPRNRAKKRNPHIEVPANGLELELETKRWLEYFIKGYRGVKFIADRPNAKTSILTRQEIWAIMQDAKRYCNRTGSWGEKDVDPATIEASGALRSA